MNDTTTATVRTTWNGALVAATIVAAAKVFGWTVNLDDLAPFLPVIAGAVAVFYRVSLALAERWPWVGNVLFGVNKPPAYTPLPPPPAPELR
jgi:hypothetical protein